MATQSRCLIWASVVFALLFFPIVLAEQEVKTIEYGISYVASPTANTIYSKNITFNPPDGSSKIISGEVILIGDYQANTLVRASVRLSNGSLVDCNPNRWVTPNLVVTNYQMVFDCSDLLNNIKTFTNKELGFRLNRTAANNKASLKMTYYNNPTAKMSVFGTEYNVGDTGKLWVQVLDANNIYVDNATCYLNVYYPFNSLFMENVTMQHMSNGIYYYNFIVPHYLGVYPAVALCYYDTSQQIETADSGTIIKGTNAGGSYTNTLTINNNFWKIDESVVGSYMLDFEMNFTSITQPLLLTAMSIEWYGKWNGGTDTVVIYIQNQTSKQWIALPNEITDTGGSRITFTNTITTANATIDGYLKNGLVMLRLNDTIQTGDITGSQIQTDYIAVELVYQSDESVNSVKGSGEMHISSENNRLPFTVDLGCEEVSSNKRYSSCARFITTGEYDYKEDELVENLTVTSLVSENLTDTEWIYYTPVEIDCTAVYYIMQYNDTGWVDVTENAVLTGIPENTNCEVKMPIVSNVSDIYQYYIIMDNYLKWDIDWIKESSDGTFALIREDCDMFSLMYNYTYEVPIFKSTNVSTDLRLSSCHRVYDDKYWIDLFFNDSLTVEDVGTYYSYYVEFIWYKDSLVYHMNLGDYSIDRASYLQLLVIEGNINDLNITGGTINNTAVAESVWGYNNKTVESSFVDSRYVGGTEYIVGESGSASVQFIRNIGSSQIPINDGNCTVSIYYPNRTIFVSNQNASHLTGSDGVYSYSFTIPSTIGVYQSNFHCNRGLIDVYASGTFHVAQWIADFNTGINNILGNLSFINATLFNSLLSMDADIKSTNETIHAKIANINQTLYTIMSMVLSVNETAKKINATCISESCNQTELMNMIISINNTNRLIQINQSLWEKIDSLNPILNNIYSLAQLNNQSIYSLTQTTLQMNQTQFNQLQNLATLIQTNYNLINNVYGQVNATNLTIMNKLFSVQDDLQNIYSLEQIINGSVYVTKVNVTSIYELLLAMNQSIANINVSVDTTQIENMIVSVNSSVLNELFTTQIYILNITTNLGLVNQSIFDKLVSIQNDLDTIGSTVSITQLNVTSVYELLLQINQSVANINISINTSYLENLIIDVNNSVFGELYSIHSELNDMTNTLLNITTELGLINNSLYYNLVSIQNNVNGLYSLINSINTTTMNKLYKIQDEIASVNDTVLATNITIMNKLYLIQDDLSNLLADLTNQLANITNLTIDITANLTSTAEEVWDVFFKRGTPPLLPSTTYYCSDNMTLIKDISYSFNEAGVWSNYSKPMNIYCEYGCNNGTIFFHADCNPSPTYNYLYAILIIIGIFIVALYVLRR